MSTHDYNGPTGQTSHDMFRNVDPKAQTPAPSTANGEAARKSAAARALAAQGAFASTPRPE